MRDVQTSFGVTVEGQNVLPGICLMNKMPYRRKFDSISTSVFVEITNLSVPGVGNPRAKTMIQKNELSIKLRHISVL